MIRVAIIYPTDPLGQVPGGTDTCIRDILRFTPSDIAIKLYGVTTDPVARPVNQSTRCELGGSEFDFEPLQSYASLKKQMRIPLSAKFTLALLRTKIDVGFDVLQFHRIEPALHFLLSKTPKIFLIHQNRNILYNQNSDVRWKYFPRAYFALENMALCRAAQTFIVREDAANDYRERYPQLAHRFGFLPTWVNPDIFFPPNSDEKRALKAKLTSELGWDAQDIIFISVGRVDHIKNPQLLIRSFRRLKQNLPNARLIMVGDGVLRRDTEALIAKYQLTGSVNITGVLKPSRVGDLLRNADALVLSSSYEGMPRCVVEALGCGLPVVSTDVGEVARVVHQGTNGFIVSEHSPEALADGMLKVANDLNTLSGKPCLDAVRDYTAPLILEKIYNTYRMLAK